MSRLSHKGEALFCLRKLRAGLRKPAEIRRSAIPRISSGGSDEALEPKARQSCWAKASHLGRGSAGGLGAVHWNLAVPALYEQVLQRGEARLSAGRRLVARTGARTGRSPHRSLRIVQDAATTDDIWWGEVNRPIAKDVFDGLADARRRLPARPRRLRPGPLRRCRPELPSARARHHRTCVAQPVRPQHVHPSDAEERRRLRAALHRHPRAGLQGRSASATARTLGKRSSCSISARRLVLIGGTSYAGEIKKSIFTVMNFLLPPRRAADALARPTSAATATRPSSSASPAPARRRSPAERGRTLHR